jgi:thioredoxin 1
MVRDLVTAIFKDTVLQAGKPVLVDFWAPWCGPCQMQGPILYEVAGAVGDQALVAKVNVDEEPEVARMMNVRSIPTLLVFQGNKILKRFTGLTAKADLLAAVEMARTWSPERA